MKKNQGNWSALPRKHKTYFKNKAYSVSSLEDRASPRKQKPQEFTIVMILFFFHFSFSYFLFLPDFYNFLLDGVVALTQTKVNFLVIGPHGM